MFPVGGQYVRRSTICLAKEDNMLAVAGQYADYSRKVAGT